LVDVWKAFTTSTGIAGIMYAWILPSLAFVGAFWLFLLPDLTQTAAAQPFSALPHLHPIWWLLGSATMLGVILSSVSTQLSRILEGYLFWPGCFRDWRMDCQRAKKAELAEKLDDLFGAASSRPDWEKGLAAERLRRFPTDDRHIAPTRFGNALRALETYGVTHFELDSQLMWSELFSVAPEHLQEELRDAANSTKFFVAIVFLGLAFFGSAVAVGFMIKWQLSVVVCAVVGLAVSVVAYSLAVSSVDGWRDSVQALMNLCRYRLAEEIGLVIPLTIADEKNMWISVRRFVLDASDAHCRDLDKYRKPAASEREQRRSNAS
jgi:hypothetical protein